MGGVHAGEVGEPGGGVGRCPAQDVAQFRRVGVDGVPRYQELHTDTGDTWFLDITQLGQHCQRMEELGSACYTASPIKEHKTILMVNTVKVDFKKQEAAAVRGQGSDAPDLRPNRARMQ